MGDLVKITGMWRGEDKNGNEYFSASLNDYSRLMMLPNEKRSSGDPDYILYVGEREDTKKKPKTRGGLGLFEDKEG